MMKIEDLVVSIGRTMADLRLVLDEETEALRAMQVAGIEGFAVRKSGLEQVFSRKLNNLSARKGELADLDEETLQALYDGEAELKRSAESNQQAIESAQRVSQRVIDTFIACARDASVRPSGYGQPAKPTERGQGYVPVAVNRTL
ncbi:MAG: hypothetical protein H6842_13720 [Rhodospirillaceae bacterium]|nr:hypothetical protein [Rhodospirillaceae bacterium]